MLAMRAKTKPGKRTKENPDPGAGPGAVGRDDRAGVHRPACWTRRRVARRPAGQEPRLPL